MKLHLAGHPGQNLFTGYGDDYVEINSQRHQQNLVVVADRVIENWAGAGFDGLLPADFESLLELKPEIILLGTGMTLRFPHPALSQSLTKAGIGIEVMDTRAACRTYNILMGEDRRVVAALLLGGDSKD